MARFFDIIPRLNRSQWDRDLRRLQSEQHNINVNANVNGQGNVENLNNNIHHLNSTGRDSSKIFSDLRVKMGLYLAAIRAVTDAVKGSIKTIKTYDDYITDLANAMGSSREEAESYLITLNKQGKELKATTAEMAESADSFVRQGKTMAETEELIKNSMVLSKVAKMSSADSTDVLTAAMNSFNLAAEDTISIIDKFTSVDLVSASTADGLAIALGKSAGAANLAGVEIDKLISMLAVMKEANPMESDATIGNAMKSILSRMNQVKAGAFVDAETGEALNDVEKVLSQVGIAMRDANGQFIESETILDEVGQKWSSFDSVTQRAVATAIAGTYQYSRFLNLMDGYSKVLEYTTVAQNSSGQAMSKFQNYEESLEAKTKLLQNSLESLAYDTFGNEFYGSVLDATTGLIQFIEKTELLKEGLTVLGIVGGAKLFTTIATSIVGAVKNLSNFNSALSIINNGNVTASFSTLLACTEGLNASQLKLILSSQVLTNEQRIAIMVRRGYTEEEIAATLATINLANAEGVATGATVTLSGAVKGLSASFKMFIAQNPILAVLSAIGLAVYGTVKIYDSLTLSVEEANEAMDNAISQYEESKSELESLNTELAEQQKAMDELLAKDKLTYAEKGELEELQEITKELLLQQDIAEKKAEADAKEVAKTTVQAYDKQYGKYDISKEKTEEKIAHMEETGVIAASGGDDDVSGKLAELANFNRLLEDTRQKLSNSEKLGLSEDEIKILESNYQDYKDFVEKLEGEVSNSLSDLEEKRQSLAEGYSYALEKQSNGETLSTSEKDTLATYEAIASAIKLIYEYTNPNAWNSIEISSILDTEDIGTTKEELIELAKAGTLSPATIASYTGLSNAIQDSELIVEDGQTAYSAFCEEIYALAEAQEETAETFNENPIEAEISISETIDNLNTQLKPTFDALKDAYQSIFVSDDGEIKFTLDDVDISTFESIKLGIDELDEIEGIDIDYSTFDDFVKVLNDTSSTSDEVQDQFDKLATSIVYSSDCTEMSADNFDLLCKSLYEMGLTNAREVLTNIKNAQEELKASGIDLNNVTGEQAQAFLNEAEASDIAKEYLRMYMLQQALIKPLDTSESIQNLKKLIAQLGMTCDALGKTSELMQAVLSLESATNAIAAGVDYSGQYAKQAEDAKKKIEELKNGSFEDYGYNYNSNVTSPSKDSSSEKKEDKPNTESYDHIERKLEVIAKITEKAGEAFEKAFSLNATNIRYKEYLSQIDEEISANNTAIQTYQAKLNSIGLSADWIAKIQNGEYSITDVTDDALNERIGLYQEYYDKLESCQETVEELEKKRLEVQNQYAEKIIDIYDREIEKLDRIIERREALVKLKEAFGNSASSGDLKYEQKYYQKELNKLEEQNDKLIALRATTKKNSDAWNTYTEQINENKSSILELTETIAELSESLANLPLEKLERALEKNDTKRTLNDAKLSNATSLSGKNSLLNSQIKLENSDNKATQVYAKATAKAVTTNISSIKTAKTSDKKGLSKTEKKKVDSYYKQIQKYTKSKKAIPSSLITKLANAGYSNLVQACSNYNAALSANETAQETAKLTAEETKANVNDLKKQQFDNIQEDYDRKASQIQAKADNIDSKIALLQAKGYQSSASWYNELIAYEKQNLANSQSELKALKAKQNEMTKYTDAWWEAEDAINSVTQEINDSTLALQEFFNTQREINFENFEFLQGQIGRISEEAQYFIDLMQNKEMTGDNGLNNYGLTAIGLYYQQIETGLNQAQDYAKKIAEIDQELLKEPYNTELLTQRQEYIDAQRDIMTNNESLKKSIADLVKDGYDSLLDSLGEVIDKYKEVLQNAKDAHDYQKNISDKTENINTLQKQITAYASMTGNDEVASKLQSLQAEYKDAQEDLQETLYDKYISDTEEVLDEMLDELETFIEELSKNIEELYKIGVESIDNNVGTISETLKTLAEDANTPMSDEMTIVWEDNSSITSLTTAIDEATKVIKTAVDKENDISAFEAISSKYDKTDYDSQISNAKTDLNYANSRISSYGIMESEDSLLAVRGKFEAENASLQARIKTYEKKISKTKDKSKIADYNAIINDLNQQITSNDAEINTIDTELAKVRELTSGLENAQTAYNNAVNAKTSAMNNNKTVIKELLSAIANDYPTGSNDEQTELDKKVSDILGMTSYLSKDNVSQLAELFGVRDNESSVLQALKNAGFATGGIVKAVGEDGIGLVRNGEGFVMPEVVPVMQDILGAMPKIDTFIDTTLSNLPSNRGNIEQTIEFGDIYMSGVNDPQEFSKQLISTFQNEAKVQKMFGTFVNNSLTGKNSLSIRKY